LGDPQREGAQRATKDFKDDLAVIFAAILQFIWLGFAHKVASSYFKNFFFLASNNLFSLDH